MTLTKFDWLNEQEQEFNRNFLNFFNLSLSLNSNIHF